MQQYYTLEEAASRLQMSPDELREMAKSKKIRAFQDRGTWRFRTQDVEELARARGAGSDPEVQANEAPPKRPSKLGKPMPADDDVAVDFNLDERPGSSKGSKSSSKSPRPKASDSDVRLVMDSELDFQLEDSPRPEHPRPPSSKSRKSKVHPGDSSLRMEKPPSDSDVAVIPPTNDSAVKPRPSKSPSDSDIRLEESGTRRKKPDASAMTEELIDLDAEEANSKQVPKPGKKPRVTQTSDAPVLPTNSPFELSEPDVNLDSGTKPAPKSRKPGASKVDKKEKDSSSDFELVPFDSSKSPGDLGSGDVPLLGEEDVALGELGQGAGNSGINLQDPADSGISLESGGSDEIEFELTLDSGTTPKPAQPGPEVSEDDKDSSSEFELSTDDSSSEFELSLDDDAPSDPSDSEFELSLDDSGDAAGMGEESGSDSEFELTLDDEGGLAVDDESNEELFEPTNFDVPALDDDESASEAVAIDEADTDLDGDFDMAIDEESDSGSESQVVALDDDEEADTGAPTVARPKPTAKGAKAGKSKAKAAAVVVEEDEDEGGLDLDLDEDQPKAKKAGKKKKAADVEDEDEDEDEDELQESAPAAPAEWGPWPAVLLLPTVIVLFLVGFMGFELIQGMFGYQRPAKASKPMVDWVARPVADALDAPLPKE
jgi:excisionase family DNA binding protein